MRAILQWVREQLGLDGHETEYRGLHPRQQEALAKATSVVERLFSELDDIQAIGLDNVWHVRQYVRASWTSAYGNTGAGEAGDDARSALGLDMPTQVAWLLGSTVRWETTGNVALVTVPSSTSGRCAVVMVVLPRMDEATGWLSWNHAAAVVVAIHDTVDQAEAQLEDVKQARRTITAVLSDLDRVNREASARPVGQAPADF